MKVTHTITIDGSNPEEFRKIAEHLEKLSNLHPEWQIHCNELLNRVTAIKTQEVESL